jgi:hypothetical protein
MNAMELNEIVLQNVAVVAQICHQVDEILFTAIDCIP